MLSYIYDVLDTGFPGVSDGKESSCNVGDLASIPGLGRPPGEGNSCTLQYSCLENSLDRGAWQVTVHGLTKSWTQVNEFQFHFSLVLETLWEIFLTSESNEEYDHRTSFCRKILKGNPKFLNKKILAPNLYF